MQNDPWNEPQWQRFTVYVEDPGVYIFDINMSAWGNAGMDVLKVKVNEVEETISFSDAFGGPTSPITYVDMFDWAEDTRPEFNFNEGFNTVQITNLHYNLVLMNFKFFKK